MVNVNTCRVFSLAKLLNVHVGSIRKWEKAYAYFRWSTATPKKSVLIIATINVHRSHDKILWWDWPR